MIESRRKHIDRGWPTVKDLLKGLATKGLFGAMDLRLMTEGVRQHIQTTRNKLQKKPNSTRLTEPQDGLGHRIERQIASAPLLPKVRHSRGVVGVQISRPTLQKPKKTMNGVEHRQQFPVIDGKVGTCGRPQAGQVVVSERRAPTGVGRVGEQGKVWLRKA